jgi:hypothetical protein
MEYTFKIKVSASGISYAKTEKSLEVDVTDMSDGLIRNCTVDGLYPDKDYSIELIEEGVKVATDSGETWREDKFKVTFTYGFNCDLENTQISNLMDHHGDIAPDLHDAITALFIGSKLERRELEIEAKLSEQQNGLEALLDGMYDDYSCFCIQSDGALYHEKCARSTFGDKEISVAIKDGDNAQGISSTSCHNFAEEYSNAFFHCEENYSTCECGNSLFDSPAPFKDENCVESSIVVRTLPEIS